ncbi:uncharacterized protein LOC144615703 [Panthera onca]
MLGKAFRKGGRRDDTQDREKDSPSLALPHALFVLQDKTLLKSNLAAFRTISEKFINVSNVVSSISKNLDYLEELLQTLTMPTPTSQREVHIEAEDFNEFSEKLLVFLEALDDFLKPLLKCPETFKASRRKP